MSTKQSITNPQCVPQSPSPQPQTPEKITDDQPLPLESLFQPRKSHPTFTNFSNNPYTFKLTKKRQSEFSPSPSKKPRHRHQRTSSAPPIPSIQNLAAAPFAGTDAIQLDAYIDTNKYTEYIQSHCEQLIQDCTCRSCHPPSILSPPTSTFNKPSLIQFTQSEPVGSKYSPPTSPPTFADTRYSLSGACEKSKNLSIIQTIGMGVKNSMPRLLSILNDINNRLILDQYKNNDDFYELSGMRNGEQKMDMSTDMFSDDDDVDVIDGSIHNAFQTLEHLQSLSPITISKSCGAIFDSVHPKFLDNPSNFRLKSKRSWGMLRTLPIHQALRTYQERIASPLTFSPKYKIKDSISHYIGQISLITSVVQKLVRAQGMPLQLDVVILSNSENVVVNEDYAGLGVEFKLDQQTQETNTSIESDNDFEMKDSEMKDTPLITPCSSNKLKEHRHHHEIDDIGNNIMTRLYSLPKEHHPDHFTHFAIGVPPKGNARKKLGGKLDKNVKLLKDTQHGRYVIIIDRDGKRTSKLTKNKWEQLKNDSNKPPLLKKVTTKILQLDYGISNKKAKLNIQDTIREDIDAANVDDEKKSIDSSDKKEDCFYFFQPPKPYGDIIEGIAMCEAMHMNTLDFLIPALPNEHCPIGARHLCGGKMFCVSFHVMSKEEVKCYLYIDQKCMRIELKRGRPITDLMRILPHYFEDPNFEVLNTLNVFKKVKGFDASDIEQFKKCIKKYKFNNEGIEDDIALGYDKSRIVRSLKNYKWNAVKTEVLFEGLTKLFGLGTSPKPSGTSYDAQDENIDNVSSFSTVDVQYEEMMNKLAL